MRKAFDTINHTFRLEKLERYGIRCNCRKWFNSYLSNRVQQVLVIGTSSDWCEIKNIVSSFSLDFKKAFDTVNHTFRLEKLERYEIRGNCRKWFNSYLSSIVQQVLVIGTSSDWCEIKNSVININKRPSFSL